MLDTKVSYYPHTLRTGSDDGSESDSGRRRFQRRGSRAVRAASNYNSESDDDDGVGARRGLRRYVDAVVDIEDVNNDSFYTHSEHRETALVAPTPHRAAETVGSPLSSRETAEATRMTMTTSADATTLAGSGEATAPETIVIVQGLCYRLCFLRPVGLGVPALFRHTQNAVLVFRTRIRNRRRSSSVSKGYSRFGGNKASGGNDRKGRGRGGRMHVQEFDSPKYRTRGTLPRVN